MHSTKRLLLDDPDFEDERGNIMEFRLTYAGPLNATQRDPLEDNPPRHTVNRRQIHRAMHVQLKRLWEEVPALRGEERGAQFVVAGGRGEGVLTSADQLAARHAHYGFNFVPLVTTELELNCSLDILFLRPDKPGAAVWGGDIDNRLKTLLDALRIPEAGENYADLQPADDEQPFFCLLEDDRLISRISVETDTLLEPINGGYEAADARLVLTVKLRPYELSAENMHFG